MKQKTQYNIDKYLDQYSEPEIASAPEITQQYDFKRQHVIVIPTYQETFEYVERLCHHPQAGDTLLVIVLNEPNTNRSCSENRLFKQVFIERSQSRAKASTLLLRSVDKLLCLLVDATGSHALSPKEGVGKARKIGCDLASWFIHKGHIQAPWIYSSDADVTLPDDYFLDSPEQITLQRSASPHSAHHAKHALTSRQPNEQISAVVYHFSHIGEPGAVLDATKLYEAQIHYYRDQLQRAGSPYAFFTLGSCTAINMPYYCQARGFPRRSGGEDFYMLNKLAKLGTIHYENNKTVLIRARLSDRVPFGTGPAVCKIIEQQSQGNDIKYYDPIIFDELKRVLLSAKNIWEGGQDALNDFPQYTQNALKETKFDQFVQKRTKTDRQFDQFHKHFTDWFDAFKTLKFVHILEKTQFPALPFSMRGIHR